MMLHTVNLEITTHCNKRCPDCCCGIGINRNLQHHDWLYFEKAAEILQGIKRVVLTGGEPTAHPKFAEFVPKLRHLFQCQELTMITNGYHVEKYFSVIAENFDWVDFSNYGDRLQALTLLRAGGVRGSQWDAGANGTNFVPRIKSASGKPCSRACFISGGFAYANGRLYGCCVSPGIENSESLVPSSSWKEDLLKTPLPCDRCWFSE